MSYYNKTDSSSNPNLVINIRVFINKLLTKWWLILIFLTLSVIGGQLYLRYSTPLYLAKAKLMIKGAGRGSELSELGILSGEFGISGASKDLSNEIEILYSRPLLLATISDIGGDVTYTLLGNIKNAEVYTESPFIVSSYELKEDVKTTSFFIEIGYYDTFIFKTKLENSGDIHSFGEEFESSFGRFKLIKNEKSKLVPGTYQVLITNPEALTNFYKSRLNIEIVGSIGSNIIELSFNHPVPQKAEDFINGLISNYNSAEIEDNTEVLSSTIDFIEQKIRNLTDELDLVESELQDYKSSNEIISQTAESSSNYLIQELRTAISQLSALEVDRAMLLELKDRLTNISKGFDLLPTGLTAADASLSTLITEYNQLLIQRNRLIETVTEKSPIISNIDNQLGDYKQLIIESIGYLLSDLKIPLASVERKISGLENKLKAVPSIEKELLERLRKQSIKEELYLFLLQKKEQTELSKAIYKADTRLIESAKSSGSPVFPRKRLILIGSVALGTILPLLIIGLIFIFRDTLESEEELNEITAIPILGRVPHYKSKSNLIFTDSRRSVRMEMFRLLRTNLDYLNLNHHQQTLIITSPMSGDGKSVTAINLAISLAMTSKSVVIIDLDLRKPRVGVYLEIAENKGVTNYLTGKADLDEILVEKEGVDGLKIITSGPLPPNPAELILSDKTRKLISELKLKFDYVIIDSPPIGIVADSLLLQKQVTNTIVVARLEYTKKKMLRFVEELNTKDQLTNPTIILNDIKRQGTSGYGGYYSEVGQGYYEE